MQIQVSQPYFADTSAPLAIGATFTGAARDMGQDQNEASHAQYRNFNATFFADQPSAANGAKVQMSNDGVTWRDAAFATLVAGVPQPISVVVAARYYRVLLVNGATAQGACIVNSSASRT